MLSRRYRSLLTVAALAAGLAASGCSGSGGLSNALNNFDPESLFNQKKPLPGDRKAVFPEGVPGVPQGVPPELTRGYQPPAEPPPVVEARPQRGSRTTSSRPQPPPGAGASQAHAAVPQQSQRLEPPPGASSASSRQAQRAPAPPPQSQPSEPPTGSAAPPPRPAPAWPDPAGVGTN